MPKNDEYFIYKKYLSDAIDYNIIELQADYDSIPFEIDDVKIERKLNKQLRRPKYSYLMDELFDCGCIKCPIHKIKNKR